MDLTGPVVTAGRIDQPVTVTTKEKIMSHFSELSIGGSRPDEHIRVFAWSGATPFTDINQLDTTGHYNAVREGDICLTRDPATNTTTIFTCTNAGNQSALVWGGNNSSTQVTGGAGPSGAIRAISTVDNTAGVGGELFAELFENLNATNDPGVTMAYISIELVADYPETFEGDYSINGIPQRFVTANNVGRFTGWVEYDPATHSISISEFAPDAGGTIDITLDIYYVM